MAQTTYQVTLSVYGNHTVGVTSDDPESAKAALAWAKAVYDRLVAHSDRKAEETQTEVQKGDEVPVCEIHKVPMNKVKGKRGEFWSCHQKNADGSWCSYRPDGR